ncbi:hypothetical protein BJV82DRAFT_520125 [Fennellomyces sp. T-0311]|nr:hypothetical protein BJV82DRAFT_520125 [Fennellomyces sp. T-0311]
MSKPLSTLQRLKILYKANSFPWKRNVMVGWDLDGNEYWEMPNPNNPPTVLGGRWKRWVQLKEHADDVGLFEENKLPVQWQGWLRHTRFEPVTIEELQNEQLRLARLQQKVNKLEAAAEEERLPEQKPQEPKQEAPVPKEAKQQPLAGSEPEGQGETFVPGAWSPTSSRR